MYELRTVTLGPVEGQGYAFKRRTAVGEARQGIFFPDDPDALGQVGTDTEVEYTGPCYFRGRGTHEQSFSVRITGQCSTYIGQRIDFVASDNPDPLLQSA